MERRLYQALAWAAVAFLLIATPPTVAAQARGIDLSFTAGPTFNFLNDVTFRQLEDENGQTVVPTDYAPRLGFTVGVNLAFNMGPAAIRGSAALLNSGALFDGTGLLNRDSLSVNFLTVRLDALLRRSAGPVELYLVAGPELRYLVDLTATPAGFAKFRDNLDPLSATASLGAGLRLSLLGYRLGPEIRYALDLTGLSGETFEFDDSSCRLDEPFRLNTFILGLVVGR